MEDPTNKPPAEQSLKKVREAFERDLAAARAFIEKTREKFNADLTRATAQMAEASKRFLESEGHKKMVEALRRLGGF
jgi:F0F1-type ATP synthase membrane subunit b/b'